MSLITKLSTLARSPQGKRLMNQAVTYARSPKGQAQIKAARERIATRRTRPPVR